MTRTVGRIRPLAFDQVKPLGIPVPPPAPGESLLGFITRILRLTPVHHTVQGLTLAGIDRLGPYSLPTTITDREIDGLAILFNLPREAIAAMTHRLGTFDHSSTETIDFFGVRIRADYREKRVRRVSPRALAMAPYFHRAIWDLRIFSFDPATREQLLDHCPECCKPLGWNRTLGTQYCDWCVNEAGRPSVFLPDYPQPIVEVADQEALDFVTGLVNPDPDRKAAARRLAKGPWAGFHEEILFETAVAFACALTMSPELPRTTLERPKNVPEYRRFTPTILAMAGRAIIGGTEGFAAVADRIRSDAAKRPGFYGVKKELGPLFCMTVDQHLPKEVKTLLRAAIGADMKRTKNEITLRRADYAGDERYLPIEALAEESGLPRKPLGWLADSGMVPVVHAKDAVRSPRLMPVALVMSLVLPYHDSLHEKFAAGALAMRPHVLPDLVRRGLIEEIKGPVLGLFKSRALYFRKSSVEALAKSIWDRAREGGQTPQGGMRISKAVKRLGMTPVPWSAIIAAIVKGSAEVCMHPGENKNWLTGVAAKNIPAFVKAVRAEAQGAGPIKLDDWITISPAAEILGVNETVASMVLSNRRQVPIEDRIRRQYPGVAMYSRADIEGFARKYIFGGEIQRRAGLARARDVCHWLAERGVGTAFRLEKNRKYGYLREEVERVLAEREKTTKIAAE